MTYLKYQHLNLKCLLMQWEYDISGYVLYNLFGKSWAAGKNITLLYKLFKIFIKIPFCNLKRPRWFSLCLTFRLSHQCREKCNFYQCFHLRRPRLHDDLSSSYLRGNFMEKPKTKQNTKKKKKTKKNKKGNNTCKVFKLKAFNHYFQIFQSPFRLLTPE